MVAHLRYPVNIDLRKARDEGHIVRQLLAATIGSGDDLQEMAIRIPEINPSPAVKMVDLTRPASARVCPVIDAALPDAAKNLVELGFG